MDFYDISHINDEQHLNEAIEDYLTYTRQVFRQMNIDQIKEALISEYNYYERYQLRSCMRYGMVIRPGDICYIDFGRAYIQEAGYQHFGLVMNVYNAKAFVIPMTSNFQAYQQAYDEKKNPSGLTHLMRVGKLNGLVKYSVLFLNDSKFINMARIIEIKGHLDVSSTLFHDIRKRVYSCLVDEQ